MKLAIYNFGNGEIYRMGDGFDSMRSICSAAFDFFRTEGVPFHIVAVGTGVPITLVKFNGERVVYQYRDGLTETHLILDTEVRQHKLAKHKARA